MDINELNEVDKQILNAIRENARLSYSEIAEKVGISRVAVKNHMEAMEEKKIIKGYCTLIDEKMVHDDRIEFVIDLEIVPEHYKEVMDDLAREKFIRKIIVLSGRCRAQLYGFAPNTATLSKYVDTLYYRMRGINVVTWHTIMSVLKDVDGGVEYERREETIQGD